MPVRVVWLALAGAIFISGGCAIRAPRVPGSPIAGYLRRVSAAKLTQVATDLVTLYGPRRWDTRRPYVDGRCTFGATVYPKSTIEMSSDYVYRLFRGMGYAPRAITMEAVPREAGHNVYVTKVGTVYPNVYIEFGAHLDSVGGSPGGADNASGSTAVIELARVLKGYPNRYSMRFVLFVAEEYDAQYGTAFYGSNYHVQQALARGEQIKAALVMDHIGWQNSPDPTDLMNEISYSGAESQRIASLFNQVRTDYGISIGFRTNQGLSASDSSSYWKSGQTAVHSEGGWGTYRPNYHGCGDTISNVNVANVLRSAQENLAVGLLLDAEALRTSSAPALTLMEAGTTNRPRPSPQ
ncbi:MAG: Peptidase [Deltaproteobacteria bacterium]|jgi:hypothetical protein|nr:Peptidase [Deltaproteobacteria bacterium]